MVMGSHMKKILLLLLGMPLLAFSLGVAASEAEAPLDRAPVNLGDKASLQRGAKYFINYCLNCHSASYMRYSRLQDLGLTEKQIKDNLLFTADKVGDTMVTALAAKDSREWYGSAPADMSVIARSRTPDWLYTYMRTFYRDDSSPSGWNNGTFRNVAMPHALYELQGVQVLQKVGSRVGHEGKDEPVMKLVLDRPGTLSPREYDEMAGDLVNYLVFMGEPSRAQRSQIGVLVLFFLVILYVLTLLLKLEYWKDVK
jgi:ubiquinol-cytochrome c reductase cytochrome c1 subunit